MTQSIVAAMVQTEVAMHGGERLSGSEARGLIERWRLSGTVSTAHLVPNGLNTSKNTFSLVVLLVLSLV